MTLRPTDITHARIVRTIDEKRGLFYGKMYLPQRPSLFPAGMNRAQRVFLKRIRGSQEDAKRELALRQKIRDLGIPILREGIVEIERNGKKEQFFAIESYLRRKGMRSRLIPINDQAGSANAYFFRFLDPKRDTLLIQRIAEDTASLIKNGIGFHYFDFWGFYQRKDRSFKHIVMDSEYFVKVNSNDHWWRNGLRHRVLVSVENALITDPIDRYGEDSVDAPEKERYRQTYELFREHFENALAKKGPI